MNPINSLDPIDTLESTVTMEPSDVDSNIKMEPSEHKYLQHSFLKRHKNSKNPGKLIIGPNEILIHS